MIAPNTKFVQEQLSEISKTIEEKMFQSHGTTLYLAFDTIEMSTKTLNNPTEQNNLSMIWGRLFKKKDRQKTRKFATLIEEKYSHFFEPLNIGFETDKITGENIPEDEKKHNIADIGIVRHLTFLQIELGKRLREANFLIISEKKIPHWENKYPINPADLGFHYYLLKEEELHSLKKQLNTFGTNISIITLNGHNQNCEFVFANSKYEKNNIYGLEFYGGNLFDGKTFDEFCQKEVNEQTNALRRLGVLRMDVDNLGNIFQAGLIPQRATLSRNTALSRSFDYFFSGYLNRIQQEVAPQSSFIIYSGGDDLFIVASWEEAISLAKRIHDDFKKFTCQNHLFSVSGGIAIISPKYPIMKGAKESEEEETRAKKHICGQATKNSISFMGTPLNWEKEFPIVELLKDTIIRLINERSLPKSFISKILMHRSNANIKDHQIQNFKIYWIIPYDLSRMIERYEDNETIQFIERCKNEVCSNTNTLNGISIETQYHKLELWAFAARWAELAIRTEH